MRIISKFHDYYDSAMGYGQDPTLIYRREAATHTIGSRFVNSRIVTLLSLRPRYYGFKPKLGVIGFCGRIYPVWITPEAETTTVSLASDRTDRITLTEDDLHRGNYPASYSGAGPSKINLAQINSFKGLEIGRALFVQLKAPVFFATGTCKWLSPDFPIEIITNPRLATLDFMKVFDSFSAFQEISMFLGMQLTGEDEAPQTVGSDDIIAASKGFDQYSFRTQTPGNKKANRQRNRLRKKGSEGR